jgi:o-succinylbenzoate synthase
MHLQELRIQPYCLPLRQTWRSASGSFSVRRGFLVTVADGDGRRGYGDCAPLAGTEDEATAEDWLHGQKTALAGLRPAAALNRLPAPEHCPPAARCGLETALLDLISRQHQLPLCRWLEANASASVKVNVNLGRLDRETGTRLAAASGFSVVKLKVGLLPVAQDIANLYKLADALPKGIGLRLDANQAWNQAQARSFIAATARLPVECLEEPLHDPDLQELEQLQKLAPFPLALDESLTQLSRADILSQKPVARLVLKPMLLGGLQPALTLGQKAQRAGLESLVTTTVDSAIGSWAAVHLAAALNAGRHDPSHGLATSDWLSQDIAPPPAVRDGRIIMGENAGLGIQPRSGSCRTSLFLNIE